MKRIIWESDSYNLKTLIEEVTKALEEENSETFRKYQHIR